MPDEVSIFAKLGSWLYGSLIHATGVLGRAFEADVTAIRVFGIPDTPHASFMDTARLGLASRQDALAQLWPTHETGLFERVQQMGVKDGVFRAAQLVPPDARAFSVQSLFAGTGVGMEVSDCLCLSFPVDQTVWGTLALMRCRPGADRFEEQHFQRLQRLKPSVAYVIRHGCHRQGLINLSGLPHAAVGMADRPALSTDEILKRLTPTECQLLQHLLLWTTEKQIAQEIHRSQHTVHVHVKNIYRKLNVNSRKQLVDLFNKPVGG